MSTPLKMMTDSLLLFNDLAKGTRTTGKRLTIDFHTVKKAYKDFRSLRLHSLPLNATFQTH